jgi:hypothetical protein
MKKNLSIDRSSLTHRNAKTHRKTKREKVLEMILGEEPAEVLEPPVGKARVIRNDSSLPELPRPASALPCSQGQGSAKPEETSQLSEIFPKESPPSSDLPVPGGSFMIARKLFSSGIWTREPLYLKLWVWIIGQASYEPRVMKGQECRRGEFITTYHEVIKASSYYRNKVHIIPTLKQVRIMLTWLEMQGMIRVEAIKTNFPTGADTRAGTGADPKEITRAYLGIKIIVSNYDLYQNPETYKGRPQTKNKGRHKDRPSVPQGHIINNKDNKGIKKTPSDISSEISAVVSKLFPGEESLFQEVIKAISSTRKTKRVSPGIILSFLQSLQKYPQEKIRQGIRTYLEREYWQEGKDEKYLLGIIRNESKRATGQPQEFKSTGSPLLDDYYRNKAEQGAKA